MARALGGTRWGVRVVLLIALGCGMVCVGSSEKQAAAAGPGKGATRKVPKGSRSTMKPKPKPKPKPSLDSTTKPQNPTPKPKAKATTTANKKPAVQLPAKKVTKPSVQKGTKQKQSGGGGASQTVHGEGLPRPETENSGAASGRQASDPRPVPDVHDTAVPPLGKTDPTAPSTRVTEIKAKKMKKEKKVEKVVKAGDDDSHTRHTHQATKPNESDKANPQIVAGLTAVARDIQALKASLRGVSGVEASRTTTEDSSGTVVPGWVFSVEIVRSAMPELSLALCRCTVPCHS